MEPALKTFLDGLHEQDSIVSLEAAATSKAEAPPKVRNDNSSGMLDMRAMAQRYQQMTGARDLAPKVEAAEDFKALPITPILAPIVEHSDESRLSTRFIAGLVIGAVLLIAATAMVTAIVTATVVRQSVLAEVNAPALATTPSITPNIEAAEAVVEREEIPPVHLDESEAIAPVTQAEEKPAPQAPASVTEASAASAPVVARPTTAGLISREPAPEAQPQTSREPAPETQPEISEEPAPEPASAQCDEVLCLLEGRACCGEAAVAKSEGAVDKVDPSLPKDLSRGDISEALGPISGRLNSCGTRSSVLGAVTFTLKISADGSVQSASAATGDETFRSCASAILKKATFAKTQQGTTIRYPVIFR